MKKILLICVFVSFGSAFAYPFIDNTAGSRPFNYIQQQTFMKTEMQHFKDFMDANERPVSTRSDEPEKIKQEYKVKELQNRAPKIDLNNYKINSPSSEFEPKPMELKEENGKIYIQNVY